MAKKRLNKKVALIGSAVFIFLMLAVIGGILYLSRDPEKFVEDGDAALLAKDYETAEYSYHKARSLAKTDSLKVEMLFKLVDLYIETDEWRNVMGCWNKIIQLDPEDVKARYRRLKYFYIIANSGARTVWNDIEQQASEFIEIAQEQELLYEQTTDLEVAGLEKPPIGARNLGACLYLLRGRAVSERIKQGAVTDPDALITKAIEDLERVRELEPDNIDAYKYLAHIHAAKGDILATRGDLEGKIQSLERAEELLEEAVERAPENLEAHINLLAMKPMFIQGGGSALTQERFQSIEPKYLSMIEKFGSSAIAHSAVSEFYLQLGYKYLDKAIEHIERAFELDKENVKYAITSAHLHYRRFSIYGEESEFAKAIEIVENAVTLPGAQETKGPAQWSNRSSKMWLFNFLANAYIDRVIGGQAGSEVEEWGASAEEAVHEIEQLYGSGEEPQVVKWKSMLELAKGNTNSAIRKLYATYEQLKASGRRDMQLSYRLAKFFANTNELGAAQEFFASALSLNNRSVSDKIDDIKPESLLDYADILLKLRFFNGAASIADYFEDRYWTNQRSRALRIRAYIGAKQFDKAEEQLAHLDADSPDAVAFNSGILQTKIRQLRIAISRRQTQQSQDALSQIGQMQSEIQPQDKETDQRSVQLMKEELIGYVDDLTELVVESLPIEPNVVEVAALSMIYRNYVAEGMADKAGMAVDKYLQYFPENTMALAYKQMLAEPDPEKVSSQRRSEIEKEIILGIDDPVTRASNLGLFYQRNNEPNKAVVQYKEILRLTKGYTRETEQYSTSQKPMTQRQYAVKGQRGLAASRIAEIALASKDLELAQEVADISKSEDIDDCGGKFFASIVEMIKDDNKAALVNIDECLRQRPVFSRAYLLRGRINAALENEHASIQDFQKAAALNPLDQATTVGLAVALYQRNEKLGNNISSNQILETKTAMDRAMSLNPGNTQLLDFYAEFISTDEPMRALAIRQNLQKNSPSTRNALLLGRMAMRMVLYERNPERKQALLNIAGSVFEWAYSYDSKDNMVLNSLADYYRLVGQPEKAEQLLTQSATPQILWRYYFRAGRIEQAKQVLEQLYKSDAKDVDAVRGLLLVAERTSDKDAAQKYAEELVLLEDNVDNRLFQIQTFLKVGLVKEAEYKLQSFNDRYPNEIKARLLDAWLAMRQGKLEKALDMVNRYLEVDQDNEQAWRVRAEINQLTANYDQAILDFKKCKALSDEPVIRSSLAKAYLQAGRVEDAVTELEVLLNDPKASVQSTLLLEEVYWKLNRVEALKKFYTVLLKEYPDNPIWYDRAANFAVAQKDYEQAEQLYKLAWEKGGHASKDILDDYLGVLLLADKLDEVFQEGRNYVDSELFPIAFCRMAEAKVKLGDKEAARHYCRRAMEKAAANEAVAKWILQRTYRVLGAAEAQQLCQERLRANPDSLAANFTMFNLTNMVGQYNKALSYIDRCMKIVGTDSPAATNYRVSKVEVLQAAYIKTSDNNYLQKAVAEYESLLVKMPNNISILNNLAYMLADADMRLSDALDYAKRVHEARPNNAGYLDTYSYVFFKNGQYAKAAEFAQAALQQFEQDQMAVSADVYWHLAMIKEKLRETDQALAAYEQALEAGKDTLSEEIKRQIKEAIERLSR